MKPYAFRCELVFNHKIRDPIYGFVPLTDLERDIIDTPIFQRLRRIHQLALTKYVYPSAEHSRFVHSIGVMHCASLIYEGIFNHAYTAKRDLLSPDKRSLQMLRLAALLHDVGHLPFSHAAENVLLPELITHEDISSLIIKTYPPITDLMRKHTIDPDKVASLLTKSPTVDMRVEHDIISGNIDADRADYLLRDSHNCGVCYGEYDFPRFLQMFAATIDETDYHYRIGVSEKDICLAESLLIARYHYNLQVPYHRTRSGYDIALKNFLGVTDLPQVLKKENSGALTIDFCAFAKFDDYTVFEKAKESDSEWAAYMFRGNHLHPLLDTTSLRGHGEADYKTAVEWLCESGLEINKDFFTQTQAVKILKGGVKATEIEEDPGAQPDAKKPVGYRDDGLNLIQRDGSLVDICEHSWIFRQFNDNPLNIYRIYVRLADMEKCTTMLKAKAGQ
ncbi:HD domain-containing protein [Desulfosarcina sp. OttesenSCG-928-G10]|nr:HD domain-containing protein [Desulfosarcina sp. OttesenSCG-928-G10]